MKEEHWKTLLRARAIENTFYVFAADQIGNNFSGQSMIIDPMGVVKANAGEEVAKRRFIACLKLDFSQNINISFHFSFERNDIIRLVPSDSLLFLVLKITTKVGRCV